MPLAFIRPYHKCYLSRPSAVRRWASILALLLALLCMLLGLPALAAKKSTAVAEAKSYALVALPQQIDVPDASRSSKGMFYLRMHRFGASKAVYLCYKPEGSKRTAVARSRCRNSLSIKHLHSKINKGGICQRGNSLSCLIPPLTQTLSY